MELEEMKSQSKMVFIGGNHRCGDLNRMLLNPQVCNATEIYNYILSMKNKGEKSNMSYLSIKLLFINTLISYGFLDKAEKYFYDVKACIESVKGKNSSSVFVKHIKNEISLIQNRLRLDEKTVEKETRNLKSSSWFSTVIHQFDNAINSLVDGAEAYNNNKHEMEIQKQINQSTLNLTNPSPTGTASSKLNPISPILQPNINNPYNKPSNNNSPDISSSPQIPSTTTTTTDNNNYVSPKPTVEEIPKPTSSPALPPTPKPSPVTPKDTTSNENNNDSSSGGGSGGLFGYIRGIFSSKNYTVVNLEKQSKNKAVYDNKLKRWVILDENGNPLPEEEDTAPPPPPPPTDSGIYIYIYLILY